MAVEPYQSELISDASLNADFTSLLLNVCNILNRSPDKQENLEICKDYCTLLCISNGSNESLFSAKKIAKIKRCGNFKELFEIISVHMSWDEHSLLTQIVNYCNSVEGQQEIEQFEKKLALCQGLQIISSTPEQNLTQDFAKFHIIINKPYRTVTIEEYQKVKVYIIDNLNTNTYVTVGFIRLLYKSLHIKWLVSAQTVSYMIRDAYKVVIDNEVSNDYNVSNDYIFFMYV